MPCQDSPYFSSAVETVASPTSCFNTSTSTAYPPSLFSTSKAGKSSSKRAIFSSTRFWLWVSASPISIFFICSRLLLTRSEEHTSELQSLMRTSYAVLCLKQQQRQLHTHQINATLAR